MALLPPDEPAPPLNPAEIPLDSPVLDVPPLPRSVSNLPAATDPTPTVAVTAGPRSGIQTSEFWVTTAVGALNAVLAVVLLLAHRIGPGDAVTLLAGGTGGTAGLYALGRSWVKAAAARPTR